MHDHSRHASGGPGPCHGRRAAPGGATRRRLAWALALGAVYLLAEIIGGFLTNSLALWADAGHMFSDVAALALSWFAAWIAYRPPPPQRTYGHHRAEILAALVNGAGLLAAAAFIAVEALRRLGQPPEVRADWMLAVAVVGLVVNLVMLAILRDPDSDNLNLRAAWLHVLGDTLGSVGAIAAGLAMWLGRWWWADPLASLAITALVVLSSWRLLQEAVAVLMESAPRGLDVDALRHDLLAAPGVLGVHDLHVWSITSGRHALSAHVVVAEGASHRQTLRALNQRLRDHYGMTHVTLQLEPPHEDDRPNHECQVG